MLNNEIQQRMIDTINERLDTDFILLFGSFAKETGRDDSDIDLAYFSNNHLSSYERFLLSGELAAITCREIDLIDIKLIDTVFTMQIFEQGKLIYVKDNNEFTRQKMRAYSMYATLSEQRAPIIENIKNRGSVLGDE